MNVPCSLEFYVMKMALSTKFSVDEWMLNRSQQFPEVGEEGVSCFFYAKRLGVVELLFVFCFISIGHDLQRIGVELSFPESFRTAELHIFGIDVRDFLQFLQQISAVFTVFYAETDVGNTVHHRGNSIGGRQSLDVVGIGLPVMDEMTEAALNGETTGNGVESVYDIHDGFVDHVVTETGQHLLSLLGIIGIVHQFPGGGVCFHRRFPVLANVERMTLFSLYCKNHTVVYTIRRPCKERTCYEIHETATGR